MCGFTRHRWAADERLLVTQFTSHRALQQDLLDLWQAGGLPCSPLRLHRDEGDGRGHGRQAAGRPPCPYQPDRPRAGGLASWCLGIRGRRPMLIRLLAPTASLWCSQRYRGLRPGAASRWGPPG